jgi:hypothetical protein
MCVCVRVCVCVCVCVCMIEGKGIFESPGTYTKIWEKSQIFLPTKSFSSTYTDIFP